MLALRAFGVYTSGLGVSFLFRVLKSSALTLGSALLLRDGIIGCDPRLEVQVLLMAWGLRHREHDNLKKIRKEWQSYTEKHHAIHREAI